MPRRAHAQTPGRARLRGRPRLPRPGRPPRIARSPRHRRRRVSIPPGIRVRSPRTSWHDAYHDGILELVAASGGRIQALAAASCREGFAGACVSAQSLVAGLDPLLDELSQAGQLLFVHPGPPRDVPGDAPAWWSAVVDYTAQMQAAYAAWLARDAARFPDASGHLRDPRRRRAVPARAPAVARLRRRVSAMHPNVYFDTSSYGRRALELCLSTFGVTQLVYGSDVPVIDARPTLEAVRGFGEAVERDRHAGATRPAARRIYASARWTTSSAWIASGSPVTRISASLGSPSSRSSSAAIGQLWRAPRAATTRPSASTPSSTATSTSTSGSSAGTSQQDTGFHDHDSPAGPSTSRDGKLAEDRLLVQETARSSSVAVERPAGSVFDFDAGAHPLHAPPRRHPAVSIHSTRRRSGAWGSTASTTTATSAATSVTYADEMWARPSGLVDLRA